MKSAAEFLQQVFIYRLIDAPSFKIRAFFEILIADELTQRGLGFLIIFSRDFLDIIAQILHYLLQSFADCGVDFKLLFRWAFPEPSAARLGLHDRRHDNRSSGR